MSRLWPLRLCSWLTSHPLGWGWGQRHLLGTHGQRGCPAACPPSSASTECHCPSLRELGGGSPAGPLSTKVGLTDRPPPFLAMLLASVGPSSHLWGLQGRLGPKSIDVWGHPCGHSLMPAHGLSGDKPALDAGTGGSMPHTRATQDTSPVLIITPQFLT